MFPTYFSATEVRKELGRVKQKTKGEWVGQGLKADDKPGEGRGGTQLQPVFSDTE